MKVNKTFCQAASLFALGLLALGFLLRQGRTREGLLMLLLLSAAAGAVLYWPVQKQKEESARRREALSRDYPQMVTLLSLYMTAGLSLRSSWEQLVRQYEEARSGGGAVRPVYEEMLVTWRELKGGVYEDRAYGLFGRRCGTTEYLRLGGLLETYVQQGNRDLLNLLEQEAASSLDLALQTVRKKGEQTGTRLLIPMLLLFALSLMMVVIPALLSLQNTI